MTAISGTVAMISLEAGWVTTEVGRQPWTVVGLLLTRDAVQTSGNLWPLFAGALIIYAAASRPAPSTRCVRCTTAGCPVRRRPRRATRTTNLNR